MTPIATSRENIDSFTRQTKWDSGLFQFGKFKKTNEDLFNCGLVERPDGRWLITRRATFSERDQLGYNDIVAFKLDGVRVVGMVPVQMGKRFHIEHFEDPRAYYVDGRTFISACNFIRNLKGCTFPHQVVCEVDEHWRLVRKHNPIYGHNGKDESSNTLHEKNWVWLWRFNEELGRVSPYCVYQASPHTVFPYVIPFEKGTITDFTKKYTPSFITEWDSSIWQYGQIRGGTPPVLHNGEYWTFFHSSTDIPVYRRQYHMGCYAFESQPPFRITKITLEPLLSGSRFDRTGNSKPLVCFAGGSLIKDGEWTVVFGVNDLDAGYIKIPHAQLSDEMISL